MYRDKPNNSYLQELRSYLNDSTIVDLVLERREYFSISRPCVISDEFYYDYLEFYLLPRDHDFIPSTDPNHLCDKMNALYGKIIQGFAPNVEPMKCYFWNYPTHFQINGGNIFKEDIGYRSIQTSLEEHEAISLISQDQELHHHEPMERGMGISLLLEPPDLTAASIPKKKFYTYGELKEKGFIRSKREVRKLL